MYIFVLVQQMVRVIITLLIMSLIISQSVNFNKTFFARRATYLKCRDYRTPYVDVTSGILSPPVRKTI
jgi:hypothetical protein